MGVHSYWDENVDYVFTYPILMDHVPNQYDKCGPFTVLFWGPTEGVVVASAPGNGEHEREVGYYSDKWASCEQAPDEPRVWTPCQRAVVLSNDE